MKKLCVTLSLAFLLILGTASAVPAAPSKPQLSVRGSELSWKSVSGADGYNIYKNNNYLDTVRNRTTFGAPSSGSYYIIAFDDQASGNNKWSPRSNTVTVSTNNPAGNGKVCRGKVEFEDQFNGNRVDNSKWDPGLYFGFNNFGTGEKQHYVRSFWDPAFKVSNGSLKISARKSGNTLLSGAMTARSKSRPTFRSGCFEIRARFPNDGSGTWPAFWLISNTGGLSSQERPELDVIEHISSTPDKARFAGHYLNPNPRFNQVKQVTNLGSPSGFHTYSMKWSPSGIKWYLDGRQVKSTSNTTNVPMHLHLNLAIGGYGGMNPISPNLFKNGNRPTMTVDYVLATK